MLFHEIKIPLSKALELSQFKEMDYYAVNNYDLPIELMMENAGLQLANLVAACTSNYNATILIGIGNGNNGGGGLVAARRLAAWGYKVHLDLSTEINKELPKRQLERAIKFGVKTEKIENAKVWVDAYLGFSQVLPLSTNLLSMVETANNCNCLRISLDIPTGYLGENTDPFFQAHKVLTLAAPKKILYNLSKSTEIYLGDLGIPKPVYEKFGFNHPPFHLSNILKLKQ